MLTEENSTIAVEHHGAVERPAIAFDDTDDEIQPEPAGDSGDPIRLGTGDLDSRLVVTPEPIATFLGPRLLGSSGGQCAGGNQVEHFGIITIDLGCAKCTGNPTSQLCRRTDPHVPIPPTGDSIRLRELLAHIGRNLFTRSWISIVLEDRPQQSQLTLNWGNG